MYWIIVIMTHGLASRDTIDPTGPIPEPFHCDHITRSSARSGTTGRSGTGVNKGARLRSGSVAFRFRSDPKAVVWTRPYSYSFTLQSAFAFFLQSVWFLYMVKDKKMFSEVSEEPSSYMRYNMITHCLINYLVIIQIPVFNQMCCM